jgi:hypothetical protein
VQRLRLFLYLPVVLGMHGLLLWIHYFPRQRLLWGDERLYWQVANGLASGSQADLGLLWPPLYPEFLAVLLRIGGGSLLFVQLVQTGLLVLTALLARDLWQRLVRPGPAADLVAVAFLVYPPLISYAHYLWPEILHLTLFVSALWVLALRRTRPLWLAVLGLLLGLALLTKSILGPFLIMFWLPVGLTRPRRRGLLNMALVLGVFLVTVSPTLWSTYKRNGSPAISNSVPFNLWVGLNDTSRKNFIDSIAGREYETYFESADKDQRRNEILSARTADLARERGLVGLLRGQLSKQYFRLFDKDSNLTDQLPGGSIAALGAGYRGTPAWAAGFLRTSSYLLYGSLLVAAVCGLWLSPLAGRRWVSWTLAFIGYNLALFLFLHVKSRYRIQLLPALLLYAGLAVDWWVYHRAAGHVRRKPLPFFLAVLILLLFLAFARPYLS